MDNSYLIILLLVLLVQTVLLGFVVFFFVPQRMKQREFQDFTYRSEIFRIPRQLSQLNEKLHEIGDHGTLGKISNHLYQIRQLLTELKESAETNKFTRRH